jgi:hypothetical protein
MRVVERPSDHLADDGDRHQSQRAAVIAASSPDVVARDEEGGDEQREKEQHVDRAHHARTRADGRFLHVRRTRPGPDQLEEYRLATP